MIAKAEFIQTVLAALFPVVPLIAYGATLLTHTLIGYSITTIQVRLFLNLFLRYSAKAGQRVDTIVLLVRY